MMHPDAETKGAPIANVTKFTVNLAPNFAGVAWGLDPCLFFYITRFGFFNSLSKEI